MVRLLTALDRTRGFLGRHGAALWWIHSLYALAIGVGFMWLGARHFTFLRVAAVHILFIWSTSLLLARVAGRPGAASRAWSWLRLIINYVNKNFYQQILFFILPVYYASATAWSRNMTFVILLTISAVLSTLDVVYDRHLSTRPALSAGFFAFNLFAVVNVALPVLWAISNANALRIASAAALIGFVSIARGPADLARRAPWLRTGIGIVVVLAAVELGRSYVPPVPLRLAGTEFGTAFDEAGMRVTAPLGNLPAGWSGRIFVVTRLQAPLGLKDRVELSWYRDGRLVWTSPVHAVVGGRQEGFRLWSSVPVTAGAGPTTLRVDVATAGGQLVGRAVLGSAR